MATPTTEPLADQFIFQTMLTCIGNKRKLTSHIRTIADQVKETLKKDKISILDGFARSTVVSRSLSFIADHLHSNDMELYAHIMAKCYLITPSQTDQSRIRAHITAMNALAQSGPYTEGIICKLYAPKDTENIQEGERCFYTRENALIIDTLRIYIQNHVEPHLQDYCLAPLLNRASIHTNTAGVFKGFYKDGTKGHFGGKGENALTRILKPIRVDMPLWNPSPPTNVHCYNKDINTLITELPSTSQLDLIYLDPPYNQHPYGSNYFMLNVIATNKEPPAISKVSGIPTDWNKSSYNKHDSAINAMKDLLKLGLQKAKYVLLSYNNEGIITTADWEKLLAPYTTHKYEITYDTYKGSRNLEHRPNKVMEIMYLITSRTAATTI